MDQKYFVTIGSTAVAIPWIISLILFIVIIVMKLRTNAKYEKLAFKTYGKDNV